jgi:hypothetical protein
MSYKDREPWEQPVSRWDYQYEVESGVPGNPPGAAADTASNASANDGRSKSDPKAFFKTVDDQAAKDKTTFDAVSRDVEDVRDQFREIFPDDFLVINDIVLNEVPTSAVRVQTKGDVFVAETLRTHAPAIDTHGRADVTVAITLAFKEGEPQQITLRRLVAELMHHPFAYVENNKIRQSSALSYGETMIFVLESGTLRSGGDAIGTIFLDLLLHSFNYKPFSNHFWYNTFLPGEELKGQVNQSADANPSVDLGSIRGQDQSSFSKNKYDDIAEQAIYYNMPISRGKIGTRYNAATPFPSESSPWMAFADHLVNSLSIPDFRTSDYIGFKYRKYHYINPPERAREGKGNLASLMFSENRFVEPPNILKKGASGPDYIKTDTEKTVDSIVSSTGGGELRQATFTGGINDDYHITNYDRLIMGRFLSGELWSWSNKEARGRTDKAKYMLWAMMNRFMSISAFKNYKLGNFLKRYSQPLKDKRAHPTNKGEHGNAGRNRWRAQHASWDEIPSTIRDIVNNFAAGKIPKPPGHVYTDFAAVSFVGNRDKEQSYRDMWDKSVPDKIFGDVYRKSKGARNVSSVRAINNPSGKACDGHVISELKQDNMAPREEYPTTNQSEDVWHNDPEIRGSVDDSELAYQESQIPRSPEDRRAWIEKTERENGYHYYIEDPNVRNVFYEEKEINISSEVGAGHDNITCSALSVTFGHRIAPQRIVGQHGVTWQFLGAGNKMGTAVFSFAGERGRAAARRIKQMFEDLQENARSFSFIKDSSSATIENSPDFVSEYTLPIHKNSLLVLSGMRNVVFSEIDDSSNGDGVDQHQLAINFIAQDFAEEEFKQRDILKLDYKKQIIKTICSFIERGNPRASELQFLPTPSDVDFLPESVFSAVVPKGLGPLPGGQVKGATKAAIGWLNRITRGEESFLKPSTTIRDKPPWFKNLVLQAIDYSDKADKSAPPTTWKVSHGGRKKLWEDFYGEFGAKDLVKGRASNVGLGLDEARIDRGNKKAIFGGDGGSRKHARVFVEWLNNMDGLVREALRNMHDSEGFEDLFESIGDHLAADVIRGAGECYKDLMIPTLSTMLSDRGIVHPDQNSDQHPSLQPDFYVYDDSAENGIFSGINDRQTMEALIHQQAIHEVESVRHFLKDHYLGAIYYSQNMARMLAERKEYDRIFSGEEQFRDGVKSKLLPKTYWEPLYYHGNADDADEGYKKWRKFVTENINRNSKLSYTEWDREDKSRAAFIDSVIRMASYLEQGRTWFNDASDRERYVEMLRDTHYNRKWSNILFGPNEEYQRTDRVLSGKIEEQTGTTESPTPVTKTNTSDGSSVLTDASEFFGLKTLSRRILRGLGNISEDPLATVGFAGLAVGTAFIPGALPAVVAGGAALAGEDVPTSRDPDAGKWIPTSEEELLRRSAEEIRKKLAEPPSEEDLREEAEDITKIATSVGLGGKAKDITMRRAYPTFKIYFIEDDQDQDDFFGGKARRAFDDFYSYSAIQEIRIVRSRKIPADLAVIRMTNVAGNIFHKRFGETDPKVDKYGQVNERGRTEDATGILSETEAEHPLAKLVMKEGVKVQIRLGYSSDPDYLETAFLGSVIEVAPSEDGRIIELVMQGYGAELTSVPFGPLEDGDTFFSSQAILGAVMLHPSVVNFGRRRRTNTFNIAEMRHQFTGGDSRSDDFLYNIPLLDLLSDNPFSNSLYNKDAADWFYKLRKYDFLNDPQDDNIFAPPPSVYATWGEKNWNNICAYRPIQQTGWEIFKEHELRHPGFISSPVPYGHSSRSTMFFGAPSQYYWAGPPSSLELLLSHSYADEIVKLGGLNLYNAAQDKDFISRLKKLAKIKPQLANAIMRDFENATAGRYTGFWLGREFGRYRPFKNYHVFTSEHHILKNNIQTTAAGTYNQVEVLYSTSEDDVVNRSAEEFSEHLDALSRGVDGVLSMKLDDNIPDEYIRNHREEYPSCVTEQMAKRYAQGLLMRHLKDSYTGELCVLGEPSLKPYDTCFIVDHATDMHGPVEVEQVVHIFNRDHGFISIITPDLIVNANEYATVSTMNMVGMAASAAWGDMSTGTKIAAVGAAVTPILGPLAFLGLFGMVKLMMHMQDATPVIFSPLSLGGRPFVSTVVPTESASFMDTFAGKWNKFFDTASFAYEKLDVAEEFFDFKTDIHEWVSDKLSTRPKIQEAQ